MDDIKVERRKNVWVWILIALLAALAIVTYVLVSYTPPTDVSYQISRPNEKKGA
jgi:hypothetical protein